MVCTWCSQFDNNVSVPINIRNEYRNRISTEGAEYGCAVTERAKRDKKKRRRNRMEVIEGQRESGFKRGAESEFGMGRSV